MTRMKRDQPAVSLLVPVYNVEKYLSRCLESARDQTLENIEVICINDGSTDRSPEIIREFVEADARFRSVDKENSGYGASMKSNWWRLEELEKKAYLEIVTGQKPLSYFDEFVKDWNRQGGEKIRGEVAQELKGK